MIQEDFIWGVVPEARYQITRAECKTEPDSIKTKDIESYSASTISRSKIYTTTEEIWSGQNIPNRNTRRIHEKTVEIEKEFNFNTISVGQLLISKFMTEITDKTLRDKMMTHKQWETNFIVYSNKIPIKKRRRY